jgi:hypothetical protein
MLRNAQRSPLPATTPSTSSSSASEWREQPVPAASVDVFVRNAAVSIVVRDPSLSEQEALRCAFETTQRLTGQRSTLRQLMLNGRTLYQRDDASTSQSASASTLAFAC